MHNPASTLAGFARAGSLASLLARLRVQGDDVARYLDELLPLERIRECRSLDRSQLKRLWDVAGSAPLTVDDFVGPEGAPPVEWAGKNSLIAFTHFEKHFVRHEGAIVGINVQSTAMVTGPGYFTVLPAEGRPREVLFDYTRVPHTAPAGWPTAVDNAGGVRKLVYGGMHDFNRRVSRDVVIGAATRLGKPIGQFYVLARKP